jgi:hypothetical protein
MSTRLPALRLILQNGPNPGQIFTIDNNPQTIGRGETCDIFIPDPSLSRQHAQIRVTPNGYVLEDLGSTNGSFVNESPVPGGVLLAPGDMIRLGATLIFRAEIDPDPFAPMAAAAAAAPAPAFTPAGQMQLGSRAFNLWLIGIVAALLVIFLLVAGLVYFRFAPQLTSLSPPVAALPSPASVDTPTPTTETPATSEPSPTPPALQFPGVAAAAAELHDFPVGALNRIDPFCERRVDVSAIEPVFIVWEQQLAEADGETDYMAEWLNSVYYEINLNGRPVTDLNYQRTGSTLNWWSDLGVLPPGTHQLDIRWYASRPISTGLDIAPADGEIDTFEPGLARESFCQIGVPEVVAVATPTPEPTLPPTPTSAPQVQAPPPPRPTPTPPPAPSGGSAATGPSSSGGYTLALGSQRRYEQPWGAAVAGDVCRSYRENNWDNGNPNFRGFNLELLLTNQSNTPIADGWTPTYTTQGGQSGRFCYHPYPDGRGTDVAPGTTGSVTFFALVPADDYVNNVRLEVNGQILQFCLNSNGEYCSAGQVASQPTPPPAQPTQPPPPPPPPSQPSIEVWVTEDDDCIVYGWNIQNVKEIYFDGRGVPGNSQHRDCDDSDNNNGNDNGNDNDNDNDNDNSDDGEVDNPIIRIVHLDDRIEEISLEPNSDNPHWRD